jgi:hypothetical protein
LNLRGPFIDGCPNDIPEVTFHHSSSLPALARKASDLIIIDVDGFIDSQRTARSFFLARY